MNHTVIPLAFSVAVATLAAPVFAQDEEDRDRGFIVGLIEDNLAAPGLSVRLEGFEGALSSTASIESLTVADDQGVWLRLEDVVLDWNRSALLRGRLEVQELSAALIAVERAPLPPEGVAALPDAGASGGFSLPTLPVDVNIESLRAERIELGAPLLGQQIALSLEASAQLADGSGQAVIEAQRIDDTTGTFSIAASYTAEGQVLSVDVDVNEAEGGLAATLMQLPGAPAIQLAVKGDGPLDAFAANIALASDGAERLAGQVALTGVEGGRQFAVELGGDMTSLFAPRYQEFFGDGVALIARGTQSVEGTLELDTLDLRTRALTLSGAARLGPNGWPEYLDIQGQVAATDGSTVLLPTADNSQLRRAELTLRHDASVSDTWALDLSLLDYRAQTLTLGDATVRASGLLSRNGDGVVETATAAITAALNELDFVDPALAQAVGPRVSLETDIAWTSGQPVRLSDLVLRGPGYALTGNVDIDGTDPEAPLALRMDLAAAFEDLARLAAISGQNLSGAANAGLTGTIAPIAGTFDLDLETVTQDLGLGIAQADAVLNGETILSLAARRTVDGTFVDALRLFNDHLTLAGSVRLLAEDSAPYLQGERSNADLTAKLNDGTLIDPRLDGAIDLAVNALQDETGMWQGAIDAIAPEGVTLSASGTLTGEMPDVQFAATVPRIEPFAPGIPGGAAVTGRASARNGIWSVDVDASGPYDLTSTVSGPVTGAAPRIEFTANLPDLTAPVPALAATEALNGPLSLSGTLERIGDQWEIDAAVDAPADITLRTRGPVTGENARVEFAGTVPSVADLVPGIEGRLDLDGAVAKQGDDWAASVSLRGPYDARVTAQTVLTQAPLAVAFTADIEDLSPLAPLPGGVSVTGRAVQTDRGFTIDIDGIGPYAATVGATIDLVDGAPNVVARGQIPDSRQLAPQLRGPVNYDVTARQVDGQFQVTADVEGAQAISASVSGLATGPEADLDFQVNVGNVAPFAPGISGALRATGRIFQQGGNWAVDVDAGGPLGATLVANGVVTGPAPQARFTLAVPDIGPLVPDISGPLRVEGTAEQRGDAWGIDIDVDGPSGTAAAVVGDVGTDGTLNISVDGSAPLGLANGALAPQRLAGVAQFDLAVNGASGLDAVSGTITTSGAALTIPSIQNGLKEIDATIQLRGGAAQIALTATPESGGRISVDGPVTLSGALDANLGIDFDIRLEDPKLYTADLDGALRISGPLTGGANIGGTINIDGAEIAVPSSGLTAIGDLPPIEHIRSPRPVQRTLERAGQTLDGRDPAANGGGGGPAYGLDLTINAPGRVFVRGRGLDAELGGTLRLTGTTANPITAGGFELIRGRLDILEQRFDLDEGLISFQGGLIPFIRLVAVTQTDTIEAAIVVEGPADAIEVTFESTPEVPQEEIVAQIFFGRGLDQLSPLQALQLANSVAVLAGRSSGGLLASLRGSAGLDDLDVTTDADGNVGVRAGKYISDNVYTDVEVNQAGEATISLNLDVTPSLTVRGSTGATGGSSVGLFFEKDY
ncbi:autotransporter secretion inner membrane protein TamB [Jannaschia faecimaris]|uniref:Autotransporter secretion inner membrane protein TamB n=1 Tax=Jannaschia faecimaris TaxID=1244108 RepID=A0A1H3PMR4_9RHOB|nr:translocation/assembly module TamB domain-containing protein [Jannaschia faecimaris]SDZ02308.1 autotransporter secretion inner membrane protein TamB [Jannaschia faecimaris]